MYNSYPIEAAYVAAYILSNAWAEAQSVFVGVIVGLRSGAMYTFGVAMITCSVSVLMHELEEDAMRRKGREENWRII